MSAASRPDRTAEGGFASRLLRSREPAHEGLAILVISSDLPEVLTSSDRILVMRAGRLAGEIAFAYAAEERIMALAALEQAHA